MPVKKGLAATLTASDPKAGNTDRLTPHHILDMAIRVMGGIDLDAAAETPQAGQAYNVPALKHYTQEDDGLTLPWMGRIWCNPPYGHWVVDRWVAKALEEYSMARAEMIMLLLASRTDTEWYRTLEDWPRCHIKGRLKFIGMKVGAPFPSAVFFIGGSDAQQAAFSQVFSKAGGIYRCDTPYGALR